MGDIVSQLQMHPKHLWYSLHVVSGVCDHRFDLPHSFSSADAHNSITINRIILTFDLSALENVRGRFDSYPQNFLAC